MITHNTSAKLCRGIGIIGRPDQLFVAGSLQQVATSYWTMIEVAINRLLRLFLYTLRCTSPLCGSIYIVPGYDFQR